MKKKLSIILSLMVIVGCNDGDVTAAPSLPVVVAQNVLVVDYHPSKSYVGRVEAVEDTEITAQVAGYLQQRHFEEGQMVNEGDLLYTIEPSPFRAQLASAQAAQAQAQANLKKSQLDFNRGKQLLPKGSISQAEFDSLTANLFGAKAQLEAANAQLQLAEVNLSFTEIRAPFNGRISESKVSTGDLVSPSSGALTTLVSLDPVHASFSVSERERLNLGMDKIQGNGNSKAEQIEVHVILENGKPFPYTGKLDYLGNRISLNTGTLAMRAIISNPEQQLLPGQHISIELRKISTDKVLVIPRRAVQTDLEGNYVMVLSEGDIVERRNVTLGTQISQGIILSSGLKPSDIVIVDGLQRIRNGMPVEAQQLEQVN